MRQSVVCLCTFFVIILSLTTTTHAFKYGDPVPMMKRSQYNGFRTEWSEVPHHEAPKFGISKSITLNPLHDAYEYTPSSIYKLSFSFNGDRLLIPWITITDGKSHYLETLTFQFEYAQGFVVKVKWNAEYHLDITTKPEHVTFQYQWIEILSADPSMGLNTILILSTGVVWIVGLLILFGWDGKSVIIQRQKGGGGVGGGKEGQGMRFANNSSSSSAPLLNSTGFDSGSSGSSWAAHES